MVEPTCYRGLVGLHLVAAATSVRPVSSAAIVSGLVLRGLGQAGCVVDLVYSLRAMNSLNSVDIGAQRGWRLVVMLVAHCVRVRWSAQLAGDVCIAPVVALGVAEIVWEQVLQRLLLVGVAIELVRIRHHILFVYLEHLLIYVIDVAQLLDVTDVLAGLRGQPLLAGRAELALEQWAVPAVARLCPLLYRLIEHVARLEDAVVLRYLYVLQVPLVAGGEHAYVVVSSGQRCLVL